MEFDKLFNKYGHINMLQYKRRYVNISSICLCLLYNGPRRGHLCQVYTFLV